MTEFLELADGTIAYDVTGSGPLVVLSHGIGDHRQAYRFLAPRLAQAGYRVASADLRGHGESSMGRKSVTGTDDAITHPDIAGDLLALIRHLGGPAVIVGHSISGGAATIAAVQEPDLVSAIVELNPFTKKQSLSLGELPADQAVPAGPDPAGRARSCSRAWACGCATSTWPTRPSPPTTTPTWPRWPPSCASPAGWPSS